MGNMSRYAVCLALSVGSVTAGAVEMGSLLRAIGEAAERAISEQQREAGHRTTPSGMESPQPETSTPSAGESDYAASSGFNRSGNTIDTPENLALLKTRMAERLRRMGPSASPMELMGACRIEMEPLSAYQSVIASGYDELMRKCEAEQRAAIAQVQANREQLARDQREASERARAEREAAEKETEKEEIRVLTAELRAGKRQPINCAQWMLVKGQDPQSLDANVTEVSLQPPQGTGSFAGSVEQINGGTLLLQNQPLFRTPGERNKFYVAAVTKETKLFGADRIKIGTVIAGFATQSGTRSLGMTDGSVQQSPILRVSCAQPVL